MNEASKKIAFYTLGCKLNFSETSTLARGFVNRGYQQVEFDQIADVYLINTCTVTGQAEKKCKLAIKKAIRMAPGAIVIVTGCYAQLHKKSIEEIPGVSIILGSNDKFNVFEYLDQYQSKGKLIANDQLNELEEFMPSYSFEGRTRSFLKIQDGCDYFCSYCTIPFARGRSRNSSIQDIISQTNELAQKGVEEIVITGVNIGDFGQSTGESLAELIKSISTVEGIRRFRLSSIEPNLINNEMIEWMASNNKFLEHFHIPLQSGCDRILKLMNRRYSTSLFAERVLTIRKYMPNAAIGADVIVGFPGETNSDFEETLSFLKQVDISYLHVFNYSERENTAAAKFLEKVDPLVRDSRSRELISLSKRKRNVFYQNNIGRSDEVLFEKKIENNKMFGFTRNYIKAEIPANSELCTKIRSVNLLGISDEGNMIVKLID